MKGLNTVLGSILLVALLAGSNNIFSEELTWETAKKSAYLKAVSEKKKVLLFGGRSSCGNCRYMRDKVFESMKPPIKALLEKNYIIWAVNIDRSREWTIYARGIKQVDLPIICVIDPLSDNMYQDRTTGRQNSTEFYSRLMKYIGEPYNDQLSLTN